MTRSVRFAEIARTFCTRLERGLEGSFQHECVGLQRDLAELYFEALRLPEVPFDESWPDSRTNGGARQDVERRMRAFLGEGDVYWTMFDPRKSAEPAVAAYVSHDIADVYGDLESGLHEMEAAGLDAAIWEWRFSFWHHWGRHAAEAIRTLYWLLRDDPPT